MQVFSKKQDKIILFNYFIEHTFPETTRLMAVPTVRPKSIIVEIPLEIALIKVAVIAPPVTANNSVLFNIISGT